MKIININQNVEERDEIYSDLEQSDHMQLYRTVFTDCKFYTGRSKKIEMTIYRPMNAYEEGIRLEQLRYCKGKLTFYNVIKSDFYIGLTRYYRSQFPFIYRTAIYNDTTFLHEAVDYRRELKIIGNEDWGHYAFLYFHAAGEHEAHIICEQMGLWLSEDMRLLKDFEEFEGQENLFLDFKNNLEQ